MFRTSIFGIFLTSVFLASCGGGGDGLGDEEIERSASALCTDNSVVSVSEVLTIGDVGGSVEATSPGSRYGSSACPGRFVVEATNTAGKPNLSASASFMGATTEADCSEAHVNAYIYGYDPQTNSWDDLGFVAFSGVWTPLFDTGYCAAGAGMAVPNFYTKVRVAGRAYRWGPGLTTIRYPVAGAIMTHW